MEATDQNGPRLLNTVTPRNLLSFGPDNEPLELNCLNVLIGPNGSGKSNLLAYVWGDGAGAGWSCAQKPLFFQAFRLGCGLAGPKSVVTTLDGHFQFNCD
jgi:hypothetical protein